MTRLRLLLLLCLLAPFRALAADVEAETTRLLAEAFARPPASATLWLTAEQRSGVRAILGHDLPVVRLRYWRATEGPGRTVWVLDEIGKEMPITVGIVVDDSAISRIRVLAYRESRGWEVQSPNFLRQFTGARLGNEQQLDRSIDGISGATLSVRAMTRMAKLALWLHQEALKKAPLP
jgi:hypothetical protein